MSDYLNKITQNTTLSLLVAGTVVVSTYVLTNWWKMCHYYDKMNIKGPRPIPFLGNFHQIIKRGMPYNDEYLIQTYGKTIGYFEGGTPIVLTVDPKLLKVMLIKDFHYFTNRRVFEAIKFEPFEKILSFLQDEDWKSVRSILTTTFTSGKLKSMFKLMLGCSDRLNEHFYKIADKDGIFDGREVFGCLTLDIIASCCFGFSVDSLNEPNNEILIHVKNLFLDSVTKDPRFLLLVLFPSFANFLVKNNLLDIVPRKSLDFIKDLTFKIIERRKLKLERRDDFIQIMIDHEEQIHNELNKIDNDKEDEVTKFDTNDFIEQRWEDKYLKNTLTMAQIFSQAMMFLFAGYETTATTLNIVAYNLANNQIYQDMLIEEVDRTLNENNNQLTYDSVNEMKFMSQVIDETLRMYPASIRFDRVAGEDYEFENIKFKKGQIIQVPLWALHHDPELYPEPYKFMPERFSDFNTKLRESVTYMPFGSGPRNCIGMRFALLEMKLTLANILSKFRFDVCEQTPNMVEIDSSGFSRPKIPVILRIKHRF